MYTHYMISYTPLPRAEPHPAVLPAASSDVALCILSGNRLGSNPPNSQTIVLYCITLNCVILCIYIYIYIYIYTYTYIYIYIYIYTHRYDYTYVYIYIYIYIYMYT